MRSPCRSRSARRPREPSAHRSPERSRPERMPEVFAPPMREPSVGIAHNSRNSALARAASRTRSASSSSSGYPARASRRSAMRALLQTEQVVDGDAGECGDFFAAQPGGAPPSAGGRADVSRRCGRAKHAVPRPGSSLLGPRPHCRPMRAQQPGTAVPRLSGVLAAVHADAESGPEGVGLRRGCQLRECGSRLPGRGDRMRRQPHRPPLDDRRKKHDGP
ncbi:MAG: hypothetical protein V7646_2245 [Pseudonocardia sp.]